MISIHNILLFLDTLAFHLKITSRFGDEEEASVGVGAYPSAGSGFLSAAVASQKTRPRVFVQWVPEGRSFTTRTTARWAGWAAWGRTRVRSVPCVNRL